MSPKTNDRVRRYVERRQAEGLRRVSVWVPGQHVETIKRLAAKLCRQARSHAQDAPV